MLNHSDSMAPKFEMVEGDPKRSKEMQEVLGSRRSAGSIVPQPGKSPLSGHRKSASSKALGYSLVPRTSLDTKKGILGSLNRFTQPETIQQNGLNQNGEITTSSCHSTPTAVGIDAEVQKPPSLKGPTWLMLSPRGTYAKSKSAKEKFDKEFRPTSISNKKIHVPTSTGKKWNGLAPPVEISSEQNQMAGTLNSKNRAKSEFPSQGKRMDKLERIGNLSAASVRVASSKSVNRSARVDKKISIPFEAKEKDAPIVSAGKRNILGRAPAWMKSNDTDNRKYDGAVDSSARLDTDCNSDFRRSKSDLTGIGGLSKAQRNSKLSFGRSSSGRLISKRISMLQESFSPGSLSKRASSIGSRESRASKRNIPPPPIVDVSENYVKMNNTLDKSIEVDESSLRRLTPADASFQSNMDSSRRKENLLDEPCHSDKNSTAMPAAINSMGLNIEDDLQSSTSDECGSVELEGLFQSLEAAVGINSHSVTTSQEKALREQSNQSGSMLSRISRDSLPSGRDVKSPVPVLPPVDIPDSANYETHNEDGGIHERLEVRVGAGSSHRRVSKRISRLQQPFSSGTSRLQRQLSGGSLGKYVVDKPTIDPSRRRSAPIRDTIDVRDTALSHSFNSLDTGAISDILSSSNEKNLGEFVSETDTKKGSYNPVSPETILPSQAKILETRRRLRISKRISSLQQAYSPGTLKKQSASLRCRGTESKFPTPPINFEASSANSPSEKSLVNNGVADESTKLSEVSSSTKLPTLEALVPVLNDYQDEQDHGMGGSLCSKIDDGQKEQLQNEKDNACTASDLQSSHLGINEEIPLSQLPHSSIVLAADEKAGFPNMSQITNLSTPENHEYSKAGTTPDSSEIAKSHGIDQRIASLKSSLKSPIVPNKKKLNARICLPAEQPNAHIDRQTESKVMANQGILTGSLSASIEKESVRGREMDEIEELRDKAVVPELIGRFSKNDVFKRGWDMAEHEVEPDSSSSLRWSDRLMATSSSSGGDILSQQEAQHGGDDRRCTTVERSERDRSTIGSERSRLTVGMVEKSERSRYTVGTASVAYEVASVDESTSFSNKEGRVVSSQRVVESSRGEPEMVSLQSGLSGNNRNLAEVDLDADMKSMASFENYSYEEHTVEVESLLDDPLYANQLSTKTNDEKEEVVVDLGEFVDSTNAVQTQHLQVVSDLQRLMVEITQNETSQSRKGKQTKLRNILDTLIKLNDDEFGNAGLPPTANLTVDEVSDIVTHINLCEQTNTPIRWDLIGDILFPNGIEDEVQGKSQKSKSSATGETGDAIPSREYRVSFKPTPQFVPNRNKSIPEEGEWTVDQELELAEAASELFRFQYSLSEDEMADIIAHLNLCNEMGIPVRWDLIHRIIYPDDDVSFLDNPMPFEIGGDIEDCKSVMTEIHDDESHVSWFSIYPEFDDCASSVTFLMDGDDIKVGKKSRRKTRRTSLSSATTDDRDEQDPQTPGPPYQSRKNGQNWSDPFLRKRVQALQASVESLRGADRNSNYNKVAVPSFGQDSRHSRARSALGDQEQSLYEDHTLFEVESEYSEEEIVFSNEKSVTSCASDSSKVYYA